MKSNKKSQIIPKNLPWGVLVWRLPDGKVFSNEDGDVLSVECFRGDLDAMIKMKYAASYYGATEGQTVFLPGRRKVSKSEYEDQMEAYINGDPIPGDIDA